MLYTGLGGTDTADLVLIVLYIGFGWIKPADPVLIVLYTGLDWICWGTIYWFVVTGNVWVVIGKVVVVVETGK